MPGFDEDEFPFFAVCGTSGVNILNIKTLEQKRLLTQNLTVIEGMTPAFAMCENNDIVALHLAANVIDIDSLGGFMQQWLKLEMRSDVTVTRCQVAQCQQTTSVIINSDSPELVRMTRRL